MQIGDDRRQVGIAAPLADPDQRSLDMAGTGKNGYQRIGDGHPAVVVAMDADPDTRQFGHSLLC